MPEIIMPKMGDAMTEGRILKWMKQAGDSVKKGEPVAEIETDKVNVDLEAEYDGTLTQILVPEGATAAVGAAIAVIGAPGEAARTSTAASAPAPAAIPAPGPAVTAPPTAAAARDAATPPAMSHPPAPAAAGTVRASPLARRLAEEHGIAVASIAGTGPDGRVTKEDVERAIAARAPSARPAAAAPPAPAAPGEKDVPLSRMRQTIARRMTESKQHAPHIYLTISIAMDAALALRRQLNEGQPDAAKISVNDMVVKAAALALGKFPAMNASYADTAIRHHSDVNISIGVALPDGLIAPTLYHCDRKTLWEIAADAKALTERARSGHLRSDDLTGGTFTISNLGMFDVDVFSAIINPPQAAILAVGAAKPQPVVRDGAVTVATMMQVTASADHRVTDGAEVARFLAELKRLLENPVWLVVSPPA
ncbi:MAG: dihydrolipoamide acetyltransferase family protein [Armatimonadota bacterium]|nr:dihydrolipoamide acetyltransferase family protein [Armatimonadota bacterium]